MNRLGIDKCKICENEKNNREVTLNGTLYGTRGYFQYFICNGCGALQIKRVPENIGDYYSTDNYYSFNMDKRELRNELLFCELKEQYGQKNLAGKLMKIIYPVDYSFLKTIGKECRILDVGCGDGQFLKWLNRMGYRQLYGFEPFIDNDISIGNIRILKTDVLGYKGSARFDVITMIHSLEHIYEQRDTIRKVSQMLVDGGKLIIQLPFFSQYYWRKYGNCLYTLDPPRHFFIHTYKSIEHLMISEGLRIIYFNTEFDPAVPQMARNIRKGHTEKNTGTGFLSGTWESIRSCNMRKVLKEQKDGAIATFVLEKDNNE